MLSKAAIRTDRVSKTPSVSLSLSEFYNKTAEVNEFTVTQLFLEYILLYRTGTLFNHKHGIVQTLNKSNLPPLPTSRQCPAHSFWVPTYADKEHDHRKTQLSMPMILKAISKTGHRHRQQQTDDHA